jgi:hypothetical protein
MMNVTHLSLLRFWSTSRGQYILTFNIQITPEHTGNDVECDGIQQKAIQSSVLGRSNGACPFQISKITIYAKQNYFAHVCKGK